MTKTNPETIAKIKARQAAYFAAGLCRCGRELAPDRKRCTDCLKSGARSQKARERRNFAVGRCRCGKKRAPNRNHCRNCLARARRRWKRVKAKKG